MKPKRKTEGLNQYLKFSGMGLQLGIIITLFALGGRWLDNKYQTETPYFTAGLALFGVCVGIYLMIKQLPKD